MSRVVGANLHTEDKEERSKDGYAAVEGLAVTHRHGDHDVDSANAQMTKAGARRASTPGAGTLARRILADWTPDLGIDQDAWLHQLAQDGWVPEYGHGADVEVGGRLVTRYAMIQHPERSAV